MKTLGQGQTFGELGLLLHTHRTALIMAKETLHLIVLSKKDYKEILMLAESKKMNEKIEFFAKHVIKDATRDTVAKYCYAFEKINGTMNQIIYKEGDEVNKFYLVKNGNVLVTFSIKSYIIILLTTH